MEECYLRVIIVSILGYSGSMVGTILMGLWYAGCWQNITFIVATLLLVYLMSLISMISKAKGFYMEPGLLGVYIVFLCWSAIKSEPETRCYKKQKASSGENWKTMISFIVELISIAVAAFSTGSDYKCLQSRKMTYRMGMVFFHFVFATGSMYFGMMFVGWDTHHTSEKWSMDAGWTSTWVHIANEGLVVISFVSILLARIYGIGWLQQMLERFFGTGGQQGGESRTTTTELEMNTGPPPSPLSQTTDLQISDSINITVHVEHQ
ncbi:hypothetical protein BDA96_05G006500 [Sorghum bicolor]|uniref:Uncharacterized protein n=1 Tax=Sorghum bicolor TaxID=4558 RepID=A0A921UE71_SORBI|nr:hypothetical protein BDA96_05G006500 [Sorghum bicolor]